MQSKELIGLSMAENRLTIDQAIKGTHLRAIKLIMGEAQTIKSLAGYLTTVADYFNVQANLTTDQAIMTAGLIIETHPYLTIEDIMIAMREAKSRIEGYEKPYGMIDGSLIFSWINTYIDRREDWLDKIRQQEKDAQKNELVEASSMIFKKLAQHPKLIGSEDKPEPKKLEQNRTMEGWIRQVKEISVEFTDEERHEMIKKLHRQNMFGAYTELIEFLKQQHNGNSD